MAASGNSNPKLDTSNQGLAEPLYNPPDAKVEYVIWREGCDVALLTISVLCLCTALEGDVTQPGLTALVSFGLKTSCPLHAPKQGS